MTNYTAQAHNDTVVYIPNLAEKLYGLYCVDAKYFALARMAHTLGKDTLSYFPVERPPTLEDLHRHIELDDQQLGDYTIRTDGTVRYITWDIDGKAEDLTPAINVTRKICRLLANIPHYVTFSGSKGYHVDIFLEEPIDSARAYQVATAVRSTLGIPKSGALHVETYPKQPTLTSSEPKGNLIKLPGCLHPKTLQRAIYIDPDTAQALDWDSFGTYKATANQLTALLKRCTDRDTRVIDLLQDVWVEGNRHDLSLALSGYLAKKGWTQDSAATLFSKIAFSLGGSEIKILNNLADTYERYNNNQDVAGYSTLQSLLAEEVLQSLDIVVGESKDSMSFAVIAGRLGEIRPGIEKTPLGKAIGMLSQKKRNDLTKLVRKQWQTDKVDTGIDCKVVVEECHDYGRRQIIKSQCAGRPIVTIDDKDATILRHEVEDLLKKHMVQFPKYPLIYMFGQNLAKIYKNSDGTPIPKVLDTSSLSGVIMNHSLWTDQGSIILSPPSSLVQDVLTWREDNMSYPPLSKVVTHPIVTPSKQIITEEGYDTETQYYYCNPVRLGDTTPTAANIAAAKSLIFDDLFVDFPFADQSSKAHALALFLLPYIYPAIEGITPIHLFDAPIAGTGKGLLIEVCANVALGFEVSGTPPCDDDNEWRKKITSMLFEGREFIYLDNIPTGQLINSGSIASLVTARNPIERELGHSRSMVLQNRSIWAMAGNNFIASPENIRRILWIRLDANTEQPYLRNEFKHINLKEWAMEHRSELITAAITLCRAWIEYDRPFTPISRSKGSFERWNTIMHNLFEAIDVQGLLENEERLRIEATDPTADALRSLVIAWWDVYKDNLVTSSDLYGLASTFDEVRVEINKVTGATKTTKGQNILGDVLTGPKETVRRKQFNKLLNTHRDQVYADLKMIKTDMHTNNYQWWRLKRVLS